MKKYIGIFLMGVAFFPQMINAQVISLSLQQCLEMAKENSPRMLAANKSVERAKLLQGTAWDVEKTQLTLSQDPTSGGSPDNAISLSQSIEFPTYYTARHGQLKAETQAEKSKANLTRKGIEYEVKSIYYQLLYEKEKLSLLQKQDSVLSQYQSIARKRYEAGEARQLEWMSAERIWQENKMEMSSVLTAIKSDQQRLAFLVGSDALLEPMEKTLYALDFKQGGYNYSQTAEGAYAQDRLTVADKTLKVAKSGYAPSLNLSLRNQLVITSWNPYHQERTKFDGGNFMGFEVGVGIPLFYGATKAKVKAAKKEKEVLEMEMKSEQQSLQQDYLSELNRCYELSSRMEYYQREGIAKANEMERLGTMEYTNGEIGYVEYVNALQESVDLKMKYAASINDYNQSVVALERLSGR